MDAWIDREAAAEYIGVSVTTLWRKCRDGEIIPAHPGRRPKFRRRDLDRYMESTRKPVQAQMPDPAPDLDLKALIKQARKAPAESGGTGKWMERLSRPFKPRKKRRRKAG